MESDQRPVSQSAEEGDVREVAGRISEALPEWQVGEALELGAVRWQPDLVRSDPSGVLHVHLADRLRPYVVARMQAAYEAGYDVHFAAPLESLYDEELLSTLASLEAHFHVLESQEIAPPVSLLACIADKGVRVSPATRTKIAELALALSKKDATPTVRGRRFESVIVFLLSQVEDFDVVERNYRTSTEELDAVVQQRATHGRVWATLGAPLILVEGKNWKSEPVPQKEVSAFRIKMEGRRRTVRMGLMFAGEAGFTGDALEQEIRFASGDLTIVFISLDQLQEWAAEEDGSAYLERLVRRAMLR